MKKIIIPEDTKKYHSEQVIILATEVVKLLEGKSVRQSKDVLLVASTLIRENSTINVSQDSHL